VVVLDDMTTAARAFPARHQGGGLFYHQ